MAKCDYCGSTIFFGGARAGQKRFCNDRCRQNGLIFSASQTIPPNVLEKQIEEVWRGNCPKCRGLGPVDVHRFYQVWSVLVLTRWTTSYQISCRSCATKRQTGALLFSFFLGWWALPGLILTPIQLTRNAIKMVSGPDSSAPSADLRKLVQVHIGSQILAANQQKAGTAQPPLIR